MEAIWEIFPEVDKAVEASHKLPNGATLGHHDIHHARRVGEMARRIAMDQHGSEPIAIQAGLAGLCHNADRIIAELGQDGRKLTVRALINQWLYSNSKLRHEDHGTIIDAVEKHAKRNHRDDTPVLIVLRDADRVVNMAIDRFMRSAQNYATLPPIDYQNWLSDPQASYFDPRSVLFDIAGALEWIDPKKADLCMRTTLGWKLGKKRAAFIKQCLDELKEQLGEEDYMPYRLAE